ncbi:MAG: isoprenylcysteine carboxylmethyltransferase family protein [Ruminococcaceae bacterium]|nr:isoprenylcysteine carboxylmethyltransferase family protein [Oscillospiraceae bacterium]
MFLKLAISAITKAMLGFVFFSLLLFVPAGTLYFANGWLLCAILFVPMLIIGVVLFIKSPKMLQKRLDMKEKEGTQKAVVALSAVGLTLGFVIAGLDYRYGWTHVPLAAVIVAAVVFLLGYAMYAMVIRENAYLSRTVKVEENQKVVDKGLYSIVRHPMYSATILMFLSMPIVLGSLYSLAIFLFYPVIIVIRINNEEKLLERELDGYAEYKTCVKYRLIPFVW